MNPRLLLAIWRERWAKAQSKAATTPYLQGRANLLSGRLTHMAIWSVPGVTVLAGLCCLLVFFILLRAEFSFTGQLVFSILFVGLAIFSYRYEGTYISLFLIALMAVVSGRYLYWRFSATLAPEMGPAFVCGFILCVAEAHVWLLSTLGVAKAVWPMEQPQVSLPNEPSWWPTVDIFVDCDEQSFAEIKSTAMSAMALDWPKNRLRTYILDHSHRGDIRKLADSLGCIYLPDPENSTNRASAINQALSQSSGDIVALFDCEWKPPTDFLKVTIGWFVRDEALGMLLTPQHFLAPPASQLSLETLNGFDLEGTCAMLRRSMLMEAKGVPLEPVSKNAHTAIRLQKLGYSTSYFGFNELPQRSNQRRPITAELKTEFATKVFRVDPPFLDHSLPWKQRIAFANSMLKFYAPAPYLVFLVAPLAYLLADVQPIQASAELFAAYALPHLIHAHFVQQRMQREDRLRTLADLRETLLAWYMLVRTAATLIRTELGNWAKALKTGKSEAKAPIDRRIALLYLVIFSSSMAGLVSGAVRLMDWQPNSQELVVHVLFLCWTVYNLLILAAMLAVAEESREIRRHISLQTHLPAMIKLPSGRTLSCVTENFPEMALALKLPTSAVIDNGQTVSISIFHQDREYSFPAEVNLEDELVLRAHIEGPAQNVYRALGVAAYSRGRNWPKWLPDQDADRMLPLWLSRIFMALRMMVREFVADVGRFARWAIFGSWMQIWKKKR